MLIWGRGGHMFLLLRARRSSVCERLVFAARGQTRHVIAGQSRPNSIRMTGIPQGSSVLELELATHARL